MVAAPWVQANEVNSKCETITYSANPQYPPYHWATDSGRFEGASMELLSKLIPDNVKLKPVVFPWKRVLRMAEHGEIDLVLNLRKTPEREFFLVFADRPSFANPIVVFVRQNRSFPYVQWSDLKGKSGRISLGDKFGGGFDEYWPNELAVQESGNMEENFKLLQDGQIDYFITSQFAGVAYLKNQQGRTRQVLQNLAPPISDEGVYFAFSKKSSCATLLAEFDRKLAALEKLHEPAAILSKYLNQPRSKPRK
jgi:polar amino acid transport system substrate-binding protein